MRDAPFAAQFRSRGTVRRPKKIDIHTELKHLEGLPASAEVIQAALEATVNPLTTNEHLQEILSQDAGATADILRLANSAYFGVRLEVKSIRTAASVVGLTRLRALLRHLLVDRLYEQMESPLPAAEDLKEQAFAAGVLGRQIASEVNGPEPDDLQVGGLIHNVSELAIISALPKHYERWRQAARKSNEGEAHVKIFGATQEDVSRWLLESWQFPWLFVEIGAYGRDPENRLISPPSRPAVDIAHVGICLAQCWLARDSFDAAYGALPKDVVARVGLEEPTLGEIYEQTADYIAELKAIL